MILLDPTAAKTEGDQFPKSTPDGVGHVVNYYDGRDFPTNVKGISGIPDGKLKNTDSDHDIAGATNRNVNDQFPNETSIQSHSEIPGWYTENRLDQDISDFMTNKEGHQVNQASQPAPSNREVVNTPKTREEQVRGPFDRALLDTIETGMKAGADTSREGRRSGGDLSRESKGFGEDSKRQLQHPSISKDSLNHSGKVGAQVLKRMAREAKSDLGHVAETSRGGVKHAVDLAVGGAQNVGAMTSRGAKHLGGDVQRELKNAKGDISHATTQAGDRIAKVTKKAEAAVSKQTRTEIGNGKKLISNTGKKAESTFNRAKDVVSPQLNQGAKSIKSLFN
jgi:hypothetical protein